VKCKNTRSSGKTPGVAPLLILIAKFRFPQWGCFTSIVQ